MEMSYYKVAVALTNMQTGDTCKQEIQFKSKWAARSMARKYAKCVDVIGVDVIDETTGEVILSFEHGECVWDTEG